MKNKKISILVILCLLILPTIGLSFTKEDKEQIIDNVKAAKESLEQAKSKFDYVIEKWNEYIIDRYQHLPKKYHPMINKLNNKVISKIKATNSHMDSFIGFASRFIETDEKIEKFIDKANEFLPDKRNPYNAVDVMLAAMREIDNATQTDREDFIKSPVTSSLKFMINSFNKYFYEAVSSCRMGLIKAQKLIKERGGRCFGGKGGEELAGSPMEEAWIKLTKGSEQLCPTGLRTRNLDEVWLGQQNNEPWIWDSRHKEWVKLGNSLGDVKNLFAYYFYAYERKIPTNELINWITKKPRRYKELERAAIARFNALSFKGLDIKTKSCKEHILAITDYSDKRAKIMEECDNIEVFKGKYIFSKPSFIRSDSNKIFNILTNTYEFTGKVREKGKDKGLKKVNVSITAGSNQNSTETDSNGKFRLMVKSRVSPTKQISILLTKEGYEDNSIDTTVFEQCANLGIMEIEKSSEIKSMTISPASTTLKIGESVKFSVLLNYKNGEHKRITNNQVTFSGAPNGVFKATKVGTFTITASYENFGASATVTVKEEEKEKNDDVDDAIKDIKDNDEDKPPAEEDQCSSESIKGIVSSINNIISEITSTYSLFLNYYSKFNQEINKQSSKVCKNTIIAYCYSQASNLTDKISTLTGELKEKGVKVILLSAICPPEKDKKGPSISDIISLLSGQGKYESMALVKWGEMNGKLKNDFNCDENEIRERGDKIVPPEMDPDFLQSGGTMSEIEGDSVDNDGNGLQDDSVVELAGYNVTFVLFDSGNLKDDMFTLSVSGFGTLGTTPKGGLQAFGLNLSPGTYTATVTCIFAPDNVGTYTLNVIQNGKVIGSISGAPPQGGSGTITFTVK